MAKWTIEFEDTFMENGAPAVSIKMKQEGETVIDGGWTPATCCALMLDYLWAHELYQKGVQENMDVVADYQSRMVLKQRESSAKSDEG